MKNWQTAGSSVVVVVESTSVEIKGALSSFRRQYVPFDFIFFGRVVLCGASKLCSGSICVFLSDACLRHCLCCATAHGIARRGDSCGRGEWWLRLGRKGLNQCFELLSCFYATLQVCLAQQYGASGTVVILQNSTQPLFRMGGKSFVFVRALLPKSTQWLQAIFRVSLYSLPLSRWPANTKTCCCRMQPACQHIRRIKIPACTSAYTLFSVLQY